MYVPRINISTIFVLVVSNFREPVFSEFLVSETLLWRQNIFCVFFFNLRLNIDFRSSSERGRAGGKKMKTAAKNAQKKEKKKRQQKQ
jgi:hypothetical protein